MRTMVMGDIHGAYLALLQCLERSEFDYETDTLIQLGDVTDRYEGVYDCVEELGKIHHLIALRGNHDAWFQEFIETSYHPAQWTFGGDATARSYLRPLGKTHLIKASGSGYKTGLNPSDIPEMHQRFFMNQGNYYVDAQNNCYVHGGFQRDLILADQRPAEFYWNRTLWNEAITFEAKRAEHPDQIFLTANNFQQVFLGHTSTTKYGTDQPMHCAHIWNVDTGAGDGGRLTIMDVATNRYWQSDPVKQLYGQ